MSGFALIRSVAEPIICSADQSIKGNSMTKLKPAADTARCGALATEVAQQQRRLRAHSFTAACLAVLLSSTSVQAEEASYPSDTFTGEGFISMLSGWDAITKNRPDIIAENLRKLIEINQDATLDERKHALVDQYDDMAGTIGEGLGHRLGAIYTEAYNSGKLPKTFALLNKEEGRAAGKNASSNPSKNEYDFPRPYLVSDRIFRFDRPDGDAYGSKSGSFPSGHTSQAYWQGTLLAAMLPERFNQILARTSQAGHNRLVMGVHYPLDVIGGRMMGQRIAAYRLSDAQFRPLLIEAAEEIRAYLEAQCGMSLEVCIAADTPYLSDAEAARLYEYRLTYGFDPMGKTDVEMTVPAGAENLLLTRFPYFTDEQRRDVLKTTALQSGYPLDIKGDEAGWQRLNLLAAGQGYGAINGSVTVTLDPTLSAKPGLGTAYNASDIWANDIGGDGILTKAGDGVLALTGNNGFGGIIVDAGAVDLTAVNRLSGDIAVNKGRLSSSEVLAARSITVAASGALATSGIVDTVLTVEGSLKASGTHLLGSTRLASSATLELAAPSAAQPALSLDGDKASITLGGTLAVNFPAGTRLCPGDSFTVIKASNGNKIDGEFTTLAPSVELAARAMSYSISVTDHALVVTLDGDAGADCK
jgi:hypothetical protein